MAEISLKIQNLPQLKEALNQYPQISTPILQKAIVGTQIILSKYTKKNDPVPYRTGFLLASFRFQTGQLYARWFPTAKYAAFVEYGTRPHVIAPKNGRVLAWQSGGSAGAYTTSASGRSYYKSGSSGGMVFAAYVNHPGTQPNPYMQKIVDKATPEVNDWMRQAYDLVNQEVAKRTNG